VKIKDTFCNCSAGFHKKTFEVIFEKTLKVDVLESILKGDDRCRFAIHLPDEAIVEE
jgi:predicted hydrocarbon binding protein